MKKTFACAAFAFALTLAPAAFAESAIGEIVAIDGDLVTVRVDDGTTRQYVLAPELRIVTPSQKQGMQASDLQMGQTVRVNTSEKGGQDVESAHPMAHTIILVNEDKATKAAKPIDRGRSSVDGVEIEKGRDVEIERDGDDLDVDYD